MATTRLLALCSLLLCAPCALAGRLEIPLRVSLETIRQALSAQLAASPGQPNVIYREGPCRYLNLETPKLDAVDGHLRLAGPGSAALGVELLGRCQNAATWEGTMHFSLAPQIDEAGRLRMRIVDSRLDGADGRKAPGLGLIWDLSKRQLHPRLERFSYDIGASRDAIVGILANAAPPQYSAALQLALSQMQVLQPRVETSHVVVPIAIEIPDAWLAAQPPAPAAAPATPATALTEAELDALDKALQPWDAFLVNTIKQVASNSDDAELRKRLFTLLLESRYRLAEILSGDAPASGDPVRTLFIDAWSEMRTILADARYALFIDAGDALLALDRAAPGLGMTLSADGLRQLARSLPSGATGDALTYDWSVDPQLRRLFDVEEIPETTPPPGKSWLDLFVTAAYAAESDALPALDQWVPTQGELVAYEARVGELLKKTSASELQGAKLAAPYARIYGHLVPTTALIESCWRQYVVRAGKVSYLRSASRSVGIMQINQHVWRGFYDVERLRWDTAYNARAGAQILLRYVKDYAVPYAEKNGDVNHVPRAAYAVYNAGPRAVGRFNKNPPHPREQRVDEKLWMLYQSIASGGQADLSTCGVKQARLR